MITCSAAHNTLNLILRDESLLEFVKFVCHEAPSSRYDVAITYTTDLEAEEMDTDEE
jgi:prolyl 3-hydroxylase /prolyl 3,4-dihydroxylase